MPTVFVWRGFRFFFYSNEGDEPPHIHIGGGGREAKVWLSDLSVARNRGFADHELSAILRQIETNRAQVLDSWRRFFGR